MNRTPLPINSALDLSHKLVIDAVIGLGANCIVYDAHYTDSLGNKKPVKLKECYPADGDCIRDGALLVWNHDSDRASALERFEQSYQVASLMQQRDEAGDSAVYSLDILECNNTKYITMIPENGQSYDKDTTEDLADILRTALALTNAVGRYHTNGYLHLDIKPSNFIALTDHTGKGKNIALFDFDTVVPIAGIANRSIRSVSFSKGWGAPEQLLQQLSKLCPATDLFAIGAILFERLMKRRVENGDMSPFAAWEFDERLDAKSVNPKAKRLITELFHKTLASNVKKRFQTAEELSALLEELLDVACGGKPYVISAYPESNCRFIGRDTELEALHNALAENNRAFISGNGGSGKSELVKRYFALNSDLYDTIVFMKYNGSVADALGEIQVVGITEPADRLSALAQLVDGATLLVLDNFDVAVDEDAGLERLLSLNCNVIITTRTDFSAVYPNIARVELGTMSQNELRAIFESEAAMTLSDEDFMRLSPIMHLGSQCTFYWVLFARLLKQGGYSPDELCSMALAGLGGLDEVERVLITKDGIRIKQTVAKAMSELFKLAKLSEVQTEMLLLLNSLDCLNLSKRQFREIAAADKAVPINEKMNALGELIEKRLVECNIWADSDRLTLNDMTKEMIDFELKPSVAELHEVTDFIEREFFVPKEEIASIDYDDEINKDRTEYNLRCIFKIASSSELSNPSTREYFIDLLYRMLGGEDKAIRYIWNDYTRHVIDILNTNSLDESSSAISRVQSDIILATFFCYQAQADYSIDDYHIENMRSSETAFRHALGLIEQCPTDKESLISELCRPFVYCVEHSGSRCLIIAAETIETIFSLAPACIAPHLLFERSFEVRVFLNPEYEKLFLRKIIKQASVMEEASFKKYLHDGLRRILLAGNHLTFISDGELPKLRKKVYELYNDDLENLAEFDLSGIDPRDHAFTRNMILRGAKQFKASFDPSEREALLSEKKEPEGYPWDTMFTDMNLERFPNAVPNAATANEIYSAIGRFRELVDVTHHSNQSVEKKELLTRASERLHEKLREEVIVNDFPFVDFVELISLELAQAELYAIDAAMYCFAFDRESMHERLDKVLEYSRIYVSTAPKEELIDFEGAFAGAGTLPFWGAVNRIGNTINRGSELSYLFEYAAMVEEKLAADPGFNEAWMYNYYKKIVASADAAKAKHEPTSAQRRLLTSIFGEDEDLFSREDEQLRYYSEIVDEYTAKMNKITDSKYRP